MATPEPDIQQHHLRILVNEFYDFTKAWVSRLHRIQAGNTSQEVNHRIICELLELLDCHTLDSHSLHDRLQWYLTANLHVGLTLKDLSDFLGYTEKYCSTLFRQEMGMPFSTYLKQMRMKRATTLLTQTLMSIGEIAELVGFKDQFAFSHFFKQSLGLSPREYPAKFSKKTHKMSARKNDSQGPHSQQSSTTARP